MAYESDHTQFMRDWLMQHPEEVEVRKAGRALWWDRAPCDLDETAYLAASQVPQKPYYYDIN